MIMMRKAIFFFLGVLSFPACEGMVLEDDTRAVVDVATIANELRDGTPEAAAVLRFVNNAPESVLTFNFGAVGQTLATHRRGPDAVAGTSDDVLYTRVSEVSGIRGVGATTMSRIEKYAVGHHFADGSGEPKTAAWASSLGYGEDITVKHAVSVYERDCRSSCKMVDLRTESFSIRIFRGGDGEHYLVLNDRHLGRVQRDGVISMTSGGTGSNPAGYASLWFYARVDRFTATDYSFTLKGYTEQLPTKSLPTWRYLLVDDVFPLPLRDLPPAPTPGYTDVYVTVTNTCSIITSPTTIDAPAGGSVKLRYQNAASSTYRAFLSMSYGGGASLAPGESFEDPNPRCGRGVASEATRFDSPCGSTTGLVVRCH